MMLVGYDVYHAHKGGGEMVGWEGWAKVSLEE